MNTITQERLLAEEVMRARHSVKHYDAEYQMPEQDLKDILELATLAPSSNNLQHWRFLVITDQAVKEKVLPIAYGQKQVVDSSAVVVVLGDLEAGSNVDAIYGPLLTSGAINQQTHDYLVGGVKSLYGNPDNAGVMRDEAIRNSSLASMQLMLAAKAKGYDTCPMMGFNWNQLKETLNIPDRYVPSMMITIGKAKTPARVSSRFTLEQVVTHNSF
ncbi:nitroreductase family protein [Paenibacillus sp. N1-5-1-14]|uniref:nitroreductase family protein n=1 Tax=Paenibacillus radicibacter TaxID=2972488 RepID=UPI00215961A4|nr:nitroreductase family protein [Paenibacillus radicibacter]MCR8644859.1 nitroreductase family protein [Paenibacillus radicibacter]